MSGEFNPEDFDGSMPSVPGNMENFTPEGFDGETTIIDIADAHISIEIEDGKAAGTIEDIQPGSMVTITLNSDGEATDILVSSSGFDFGGGMFMRGN